LGTSGRSVGAKPDELVTGRRGRISSGPAGRRPAVAAFGSRTAERAQRGRPDLAPVPVTVTKILAESIRNVFADESVSAIFVRRGPAVLVRASERLARTARAAPDELVTG